MEDIKFNQPTSHNPDGVIGDTVDEVSSPFSQPPLYTPATHESDFVEPVRHDPDLVVGDTLNEVNSTFAEPIHHDPSLVIGDVISEVEIIPGITAPPPPFNPSDVQLPVPHNPTGVIGDDISEVQVLTTITPVHPPFTPSDVQVPPPYTPPTQVEVPVLTPPGLRPIQEIPQNALDQANSSQHIPKTIQEILADLKSKDEKLEARVAGLDRESFFNSLGGPIGAAGGHALDITATARYVENYVKAAGPSGVATFVAIQTALHRMNSKYGKVFNPLYIATLVGPSSFAKIALDVDDSIHTRMTSIEDELAVTQALAGKDEFSKQENNNTYGPSNKYSEDSVLLNGPFVDLALGGINDPQGAAIVQSISENVDYGNGLKRRQIDMSKMFDRRTGKLLPKFAAGSNSRKSSTENQKLIRSAFNWQGSKGVIPTAFNVEDEVYGNVKDELDDDEVYMPFMLQDLRPDPNGDTRKVYLRALNIQTNESFSPNWNEEEAFGRVDPIMGYKSTGRSIDLSFAIRAFSPEDLKVLLMKKHWITSMVYPSIRDDLTMSSGPIVRLRLGDLYNNNRGGLPGIIKSLDFDYNEQIWELKSGYKVPHGFNVNISFQVLHEATPGINNGSFTTVRASIPQRSQSDPSRFDPIVTEIDDGLFSAIKIPRRK